MTQILIIEDDQTILSGLLDILEFENYEVLTAANGIEGIELATSHSPDLILCDIRMPQATGYEVYEALQKNPDTAAIPFIFMTAKINGIEKRLYTNTVDYLSKPFPIEDLLDLIRKKLGS